MAEGSRRALWGRAAAGAAGLLVASWWLGSALLIERVAPHADEIVHYRPLHCATSGVAAYLPPSHCTDWELRPPGAQEFLPLRAYRYIGVGAAALYAPVWAVWRDHRSARWLGWVGLAAFAVALAALTGAPLWMAALLGVVNVPLAYQMIFDTGPVAFQLVAVLGVAWWLPRLRGVVAGAALGGVVFLAFEHKPVFAALLPSTALLALAFLPGSRGDGRTLDASWARGLATAGGVFAALCTWLLLSVDHQGDRYLDTVLRFGRAGGPALDWGERMSTFAPFAADFANFSHRMLLPSGGWGGATGLWWGLAALLLGGAAGQALRSRTPAARLLLLRLGLSLAAAALALGVLLRSREAWAGHHVVLVAPFLAVALALAARQWWERAPQAALALLLAMALCQAAAAAALFTREPHQGGKVARPLPEGVEGWGALALVEEIRRPEWRQGRFFVVTHWGITDLLTLEGPRDAVLLDLHEVGPRSYRERVEEVAGRTGLAPAFVVRGAPPPGARQLHPGLRRVFPEGEAPAGWQLWVP